MGLKPSEIGTVSLYDFNLMAEAHNEKVKHDYEIMRINAYLISVYSGIDSKSKRKLSPSKMFPLDEKEKNKLSRKEVQDILARSNARRGIC